MLQALKDKDTLANAPETLGWKHSRPDLKVVKAYRRPVTFIVTLKHPYFWAQSLQKRPYAHYSPANFHQMEFDAFAHALYVPCLRENLDKLYYDSVLEVYAAKLTGYLQLAAAAGSVYFVQYETILNRPEQFLERLAGIFDLKEPPHFPAQSAKDDGVSFEDYRKKYDMAHLDEQTAESRAFFSQQIPEQLLNRFGYSHKPPT